MNNNDENGSVEMRYMTRPMYEGTVSSEVSCDHTLPDYLPEIRRLLYITGTIIPPAKYVGGSNAELDGTIDLSVLYVGSDGGLYTAPISCGYNLSVPLENVADFDLNEGVVLFATSNAENINARVSGPRRFTVRMRLRTYVRAYGKMPYSERCMGNVSEESIQRLTQKARVADLVSALSDVISVSDEINGVSDEVRVIGADAKVLVDEALIGQSGATARGNVIIKLLCAQPDGRIESLSRKVAFEGEIDAEIPVGDPKYCRVSGCVSDLSVNVDDGKIICDANIILDAQIGVNRSLRYTADMYSTDQYSTCEYADRAIPVVLRAFNGNFSQSERIPLSELSIPEGAEAVDVCANVSFDGFEAVGGKYVLTGQSRYVLVCEKEGEYSACEITLPVRYEAEGGQGKPCLFDAVAEVIGCRVRVGGENLELDAEIGVGVTFMGEENIRTLKNIEFTEPVQKDNGELILCYPSPDDTSWSVAKRYSVAVADVSGDPANDAYLIIRS